MSHKVPYKKPALDLDSQVKRLKERGVTFLEGDTETLEWALKFIGYYRLSAYWKAFEQENKQSAHSFTPGTKIGDILDLYNFDRKLRLHFLDALERIEIAIKALINNHMALYHTPFWFLEKALFKDEYYQDVDALFIHNKALNDPHHEFLIHYKSKYEGDHAPSWMVLEALNFTDISKIYSFLKNTDAKIIADFLDLSPRILKSWLRSLTHTRNVCAHHSRLWNRRFNIFPEISREIEKAGFKRGCVGEQTLLICYFLKRISPHSKWSEHLNDLIVSYKPKNVKNIEFENDWLEIIEKAI